MTNRILETMFNACSVGILHVQSLILISDRFTADEISFSVSAFIIVSPNACRVQVSIDGSEVLPTQLLDGQSMYVF